MIADAGPDQEIELGETVTLTATGGDSYEWSTGETAASIEVSPESTTTYSVEVLKGSCSATDEVVVTIIEREEEESVTVEADAGADRVICLGDEVTLTATGGDSYQWSTGETTASITVVPEQTTTYAVTVSIGEVTDTAEVNVEVQEVIADAGPDQEIELGETVTLTASGGDSYEWSTGETSQSIEVIAKGTKEYEVIVRKGDCTDSDRVTVRAQEFQNQSIIAQAGKDESICLGESVTLTASGGSRYEWSTGEKSKRIVVQPTETMIYRVKVFEGDQFDIDEVTVNVSSLDSWISEDKVIRPGEEITLQAFGGDKYLWSTGEESNSITIKPLESKKYSVQIIKGNCSEIKEVYIEVKAEEETEVPEEPVAQVIKDQTICVGETAVLTASGGSEYFWSDGQIGSKIEVRPMRTTKYTVEVRNEFGLDTQSVIVYVESCRENISKTEQLEMIISPNPSRGQFRIDISNLNSQSDLFMYDLNGRIVFKEMVGGSFKRFSRSYDFSHLPKGIYLVNLHSEQGVISKKVLLT